MKIAITSQGEELSSLIDPRFGRCSYFFIFDENGELLKKIKNESLRVVHGAGVTAAQVIAEEGIDIVITGNMGPNAIRLMQASGIKVISGVFDKSLKEVITMFKNKEI